MTEEQAFIEWKAEQYKHQSTEEELEFVEHLHYFLKYFKKTFQRPTCTGKGNNYKVFRVCK